MGDGYAIRLNSVEYDAGDDRAALTALVMGAGAATARAGRRPGPGLTVTVGGTPEAATLSPGVCVVTDPVGGMYLVAFPNNVTKNLATRPGTGTSRNDLAVARIYDADVHSADTTLREVDFELVTGTASASPSTPTKPDGALLLNTLTVPATGTISVSQNGPRTVAAGGILPVASQAERDALTVYDGLVVYREDTDTFEARIDGVWQQLFSSSRPFARMNKSGTGQTFGSSNAASQATLAASSESTPTGFADTANNRFVIPTAGVYRIMGQIVWDANNSGARNLQIRVNGNAVASDDRAGSGIIYQAQPMLFEGRLNAGDLVTLWAAQNSGGNLQMHGTDDNRGGTYITAMWVRP